nr:putative nuclease HARBI1 [Onthophagus taurus]
MEFLHEYLLESDEDEDIVQLRMPTGDQIEKSQEQFYGKARFPRVIGSIDCTHISIISPGGPRAETFRNRKGFFSLNVQTVSSVDLKILDIVACWPGSAHDQHIFDNSLLKQRFENNEFGNALLVGDSGYRNTKYLVTPLLNTRNRVEELYNESLIRTRNPVERQYGVWKRRFPVLALKLRLKLETAMTVIVATAVLHNIAINAKEEIPPYDLGINVNTVEVDNLDIEDGELLGNARNQLLANYFPNLLN